MTNDLADLLSWCLMIAGAIYFVTESVIASPFRGFVVGLGRALHRGLGGFLTLLLYCPACAGFWLGLSAGYALESPFTTPLEAGVVAMALGALWGRFVPGVARYNEEPLAIADALLASADRERAGGGVDDETSQGEDGSR